MFIKKAPKKNGTRTYLHYKLVESYRDESGPKHRTLLYLGSLDELDADQIKLLAKVIESKLKGENKLLFNSIDEKVEILATHFAQLFTHRELVNAPTIDDSANKQGYETVNLKSIAQSSTRTIGAEHAGVSALKILELDKLFLKLGFSQAQTDHAILSIVGRLVNPGSELNTTQWAKKISGIDELLNTDFSDIALNALYRVSDLLLKNQNAIENHLSNIEKDLFSLDEKIILYDLTNTYFEGSPQGNSKAAFGRSKEKRTDRPLLTLGLVLDGMGFVKKSRIFSGNIGESKTLLEMLEDLTGSYTKESESSKRKTVVMDAGISTDKNLDLIKSKGFDYICVSRSKIKKPGFSQLELTEVINKKGRKVGVKLIKDKEEKILYCQSEFKQKKEMSMLSAFQKRFEEGLELISSAIHKKRGMKKYEKVIERIGRLKEKNKSVARYYKIDVEQIDGITKSVNWELNKEEAAKERFSGSYFLKTNRKDLDEKKIWSIYNTLTDIENAFRCLKLELGMRPIHHQKESRADAHIFITVLAYHLLHLIRVKLRHKGINKEWRFIRKLLATQVRITTTMKTKNKGVINIRSTSEPEDFHLEVFNAMGIKHKASGMKIIKKIKM